MIPKEDLCAILEIVLLHHEGIDFHKMLNYKLTIKQITTAMEAYKLINEKWK